LADNLSVEKRSKVMSSIKGRDTIPEMKLWKELDHRMIKKHPLISGNPDFGSKLKKIAVFVDGCFWHGCPRCYKLPSTRQEYWKMKLSRNKLRDLEVTSFLASKGYIVMRFWEHEIIKDAPSCAAKVLEAASSRKN
jgi:DNA mismatch endonuclease (patch repair protein)